TYWPEVGRGLVAGKRHGLLDRIDSMALFLGCRQINRQIIWVARSCLKKFRSFLQAWDVMLEIRKSPGYQNVHSDESRRWKLLFQALEDGLHLLLRLLQGFCTRRDIQFRSDDM